MAKAPLLSCLNGTDCSGRGRRRQAPRHGHHVSQTYGLEPPRRLAGADTDLAGGVVDLHEPLADVGHGGPAARGHPHSGEGRLVVHGGGGRSGEGPCDGAAEPWTRGRNALARAAPGTTERKEHAQRSARAMVAQIPAPARLPHAAACRPLCTMHAQLAASSLRLRRMLVRVRRRLGLLAFSSPVSGYADSTACRSHHTTVWLQTHKSEDPRRRQRTQAKPAAAAVRAGNALPRSRRSLRRPPRRATPLFFRRPAARPASLVQRHEMPPRTHRSKPATRFRPAATVSSAFVARPCPLRGGSSSPPRAARGGGRPTHRQRKKERGCELTPVTQFFRCPMARGRGDSTAFHPSPPRQRKSGTASPDSAVVLWRSAEPVRPRSATAGVDRAGKSIHPVLPRQNRVDHGRIGTCPEAT